MSSNRPEFEPTQHIYYRTIYAQGVLTIYTEIIFAEKASPGLLSTIGQCMSMYMRVDV